MPVWRTQSERCEQHQLDRRDGEVNCGSGTGATHHLLRQGDVEPESEKHRHNGGPARLGSRRLVEDADTRDSFVSHLRTVWVEGISLQPRPPEPQPTKTCALFNDMVWSGRSMLARTALAWGQVLGTDLGLTRFAQGGSRHTAGAAPNHSICRERGV